MTKQLPNPCDALRALEELLGQADFVYLTRTEGDEPGQRPLYYLSCRREGQAERAAADTLEELLRALGPRAGRKVCRRCGQEKRYAEFPRAPARRDRPEGRHIYCKVCERRRLSKYRSACATGRERACATGRGSACASTTAARPAPAP